MIKAKNFKGKNKKQEPEAVDVVKQEDVKELQTPVQEDMPVEVVNEAGPSREFEESKDESGTVDPMARSLDIWRKFSEKYPNLANAFETSMIEQLMLLASKMMDYGTGNMKAGTNLATAEEVSFALEGVWFRLNDKVQRWRNMIFTKAEPNNESLYDTFMDIANYAVIAKLISRGQWDDR